MTMSETASPVAAPSPDAASLPSHSNMSRYVVFCAPKAGMANVNAQRVNDVVYEMSKNSAHFRHAQASAERVTQRISEMKRTIAETRSVTPGQQRALKQRAASLIESLESERDMTKTWMHVDLDSFFASVELLDRPDLRDKPVAVGGMSMISTANYAARQYGVRSAMPGFIAVKLCPQLIFLRPDFAKYTKVAAVYRGIFAEYDPQFETMSLDEAYLDITAQVSYRIRSLGHSGSPHDHPSLRDSVASDIASELRARVLAATGLTCSAGIACNRMLAKICTDVNKPNGQHCLATSLPNILSFMATMNVRKIPGIGKVMERMLNEIGINQCGEIRNEQHAPLLLTLFTPSSYTWLFRASLGIGRTEHESEAESRRKSISCERTFAALTDYSDLVNKLTELCRSLAADVNEKKLRGKTVTLKLKTVDFTVLQRSLTLDRYVSSFDGLFRTASQLLREELHERLRARSGLQLFRGESLDGLLNLRLMGVRLSALYDDSGDSKDESIKGTRSIKQFVMAVEPEAAVDVEIISESASTSVSAGFSKRRRVADITQFSDVTSAAIHSDDLRPTEDEDVHHSSAPALSIQNKQRISSIENFFRIGGNGDGDGDGESEQDDDVRIVDRPDTELVSNADHTTALLAGCSTDRSRSTAPIADVAAPAQVVPLPAAASAPVMCPVCSAPLSTVSNLAVNAHIDHCLGLTHDDAVSITAGTCSSKQLRSSAGKRVVGKQRARRKSDSVLRARSIESFLTRAPA